MENITGGPQLFGTQHLIYMIIIFAASITAWILLGRRIKDTKRQDFIIRICGIILLAVLIINRACLVIYLKRPFLPQSWCSAVAMFTGICVLVLKRDHPAFHYLAPVGVISGLMPTLLADYLNEGYLVSGSETIFFPTTISALIYHNLLLFISVLMFVFGFVKPSLKKWHYFVLGYGLCMLYGVIYMELMDDGFTDIIGKSLNFMNINKPIIGSLDAGRIFLIGVPAFIIYLAAFDIFKYKKEGLIYKKLRKKDDTL